MFRISEKRGHAGADVHIVDAVLDLRDCVDKNYRVVQRRSTMYADSAANNAILEKNVGVITHEIPFATHECYMYVVRFIKDFQNSEVSELLGHGLGHNFYRLSRGQQMDLLDLMESNSNSRFVQGFCESCISGGGQSRKIRARMRSIAEKDPCSAFGRRFRDGDPFTPNLRGL